MQFYFSTSKNLPKDEGVYLIQDNVEKQWGNPWDDFGHVMLFAIYYIPSGMEKIRLGYVRVLCRDDSNTSSYFKKHGNDKGNGLFDVTSVLNKNSIVSLPEKIEFYQAVNKAFLTDDKIRSYLRGICDASYLVNLKATHETWDGYTGALFRDSSSNETILTRGVSIALGQYKINNELSILVNDLPDTFESIKFDFFKNGDALIENNNINLMIGKNGLGKTYILRHLIDILAGVSDFEKRPYINKILVIAYSPFENFKTKKDIIKELKNKYSSYLGDVTDDEKLLTVNDYEYIGFKNEDSVFDIEHPKKYSIEALKNIIKLDQEDWWKNTKRFQILRETLLTAINFTQMGVYTKDNVFIDVSDLNSQIIEIKNEDFDFKKGIVFINDEEIIELSAGQIIFSYMIPSILSEITDETLLVIDEPELYLHPTLEIELITMLKNILKKFFSYSIIATHSAVLAREINSVCVNVLKKQNEMTIINRPSVETYGGALDQIIGEVFDDFRTTKSYQKDIDNLIEKKGISQDLVNSLSENVGDEALFYLTSHLDGENDIEVEPIK
ncbi:AAA family ATPase [Raoultella scottii]|uniref:AAA family ATPase n=1 Tax=Raoultella scottii TaxID=3040937 RepID=UPI002FB3AE8B